MQIFPIHSKKSNFVVIHGSNYLVVVVIDAFIQLSFL